MDWLSLRSGARSQSSGRAFEGHQYRLLYDIATIMGFEDGEAGDMRSNLD